VSDERVEKLVEKYFGKTSGYYDDSRPAELKARLALQEARREALKEAAQTVKKYAHVYSDEEIADELERLAGEEGTK
jgi:hypothetical protein